MTIATTALLGQGLALQLGDGASPEVFTILAQVNDVSGLGEESPLVDVTHYQSSRREFINGLADGKEFTAKANYLPNDVTQLAAIAAKQSGASKNVRVVLPSPHTDNWFYFAVQIRAYEIMPPVDGKMEIQFTFKPSGDFNYQASA